MKESSPSGHPVLQIVSQFDSWVDIVLNCFGHYFQVFVSACLNLNQILKLLFKIDLE